MLRKALIVQTEIRLEALLIPLLNSAFPSLDIAVTGQEEARNLLAKTRFELVVIVGIDPISLEFLKHAHGMQPAANAIVVETSLQRSMIVHALLAGARGYLLMTEPPNTLVTRLHAVARGELSLSPVVSGVVFNHFSGSDHRLLSLTIRQRDILRMMAIGCSTREIAQQLSISFNTADTHIRRVYMKLSVRSRAEAACAAQRLGLLVEPAT